MRDFSPNVRPIAAVKARVWLAQGRLADALDSAREQGLSAQDELSYGREFERRTVTGGTGLRVPAAVVETKCRPKVGWSGRNELIHKLLADECQLRGSHDDVEAHHIRKLADLNRPGRRAKPRWAPVMAARRRKTLVVCRSCHEAIHAGRPTRERPSE